MARNSSERVFTMKKSQELAVREAGVKKRLAEIGAVDELTAEIAAEAETLQAEYTGLQTRMAAALVAEADVLVADAAPPADSTPEGRELKELIAAASVGAIVGSFVQHRQSTGPEADLQKHFGLEGNTIPHALLQPPRQERALTATGSGQGNQEAAAVSGPFPSGEADFCGVERVTVAPGTAIYPVITVPAPAAASVPCGSSRGGGGRR